MLKKLAGLTRDNRGSAMIEGGVTFIILSLFTAIFLSGYGIVSKKQQLDTVASEIKRYVEIQGEYTDTEKAEIQDMLNRNNISASITCSASGQIPLGDGFTITLSSSGVLGFGGSNGITIPVTGEAQGRSEVYWKWEN